MKIDSFTKLLLALIALGLFANALSPLLRPKPVRAANSTTCKGTLKANAWGGTEASIGGYDVDVTCSE
jgi:hypothetical protein